MIERIPFEDDKFNYNPLEASIHVARYQVAKQFVSGRRVLDIACGEGYGSLLMKQWGAKQVTGVDIDFSAIESAKRNFMVDGVSFICGDAETLTSNDKFDVIVSLETMEHVENEQVYLSKLKSLLAEGGVLILSCPNDHWYFGENESNPYHLRKYTFQDFVSACRPILGDADTWLLGSNIFGYANFPFDPATNSINLHKSDVSMKDIVYIKSSDTSLVFNDGSFLPNQSESLYYIGIWGVVTDIMSSNVFPIKPINLDINTINEVSSSCGILQNDLEIKNLYINQLNSSNELLHDDINTKNLYLNELEVANSILKENIEIKNKYIEELENALTLCRTKN